MNAEGFARVLADSGLSRVELAQLYGVSRQTIHSWSTGTAPRAGSYLARMESVITAALVNSLAKRLLPLPAMSKDVRAARMARMARTLQSLKLPPAN